jgi:hypothetical protein
MAQNEEAVRVNNRLSDRLDRLAERLDWNRDSRPSDETKGADPPTFDGKPQELEAWILACRLRFAMQPSKFTAEAQKTIFATSFLGGPPKAWINPLASKFLAERTGVPEFESFETFVKSLKTYYGDPNLERNSVAALKILKQTSSVSEYLSRFIGHSQHTQLNDAGLREYFYDGLKDSVKDELATKRYTSLTELQEMATYIDTRLHERKVERERTTRRNPEPNPWNNSTRSAFAKAPSPAVAVPHVRAQPTAPAAPTPASDGSTPMELDHVRLGKLSEADRDRCVREHRCFRCRRFGHFQDTCQKSRVYGIEMALAENDGAQE